MKEILLVIVPSLITAIFTYLGVRRSSFVKNEFVLRVSMTNSTFHQKD